MGKSQGSKAAGYDGVVALGVSKQVPLSGEVRLGSFKSNTPNGRKPRPILEFPPPFGDLQAAVVPFSKKKNASACHVTV